MLRTFIISLTLSFCGVASSITVLNSVWHFIQIIMIFINRFALILIIMYHIISILIILKLPVPAPLSPTHDGYHYFTPENFFTSDTDSVITEYAVNMEYYFIF